MNRRSFLLSLFGGYATLQSACVRQANAAGSLSARQIGRTADNAPGWVIVLAADWEKEGSLSVCIQNDAIRACVAMIGNWRVPPDHIILLAEGEYVRRFAERYNTTLSGTISNQSTFISHVEEWEKNIQRLRVENMIADIPDADLKGRAESLLQKDLWLKLHGKPTTANFHTACDLVSHLASAGQYVAVIVSSHASPDKKALVTLPNDQRLSPADFNLSKCKANRKILIIDADKVAETELTNWQSSFPRLNPAKELPEYTVLSASDGQRPSRGSTPAFLSHLIQPTGTFFLVLFDTLRQYRFQPLDACKSKIATRYTRKIKDTSTIVRKPTPAWNVVQNIPVHKLFRFEGEPLPNGRIVSVVNPEDVQTLVVKSDTDDQTEVGGIVIRNNILDMEIPSTRSIKAKARAEVIAKRIRCVVGSEGLNAEDLRQIQPAWDAKSKQHVVAMPLRIKGADSPYIITVEEELQRFWAKREGDESDQRPDSKVILGQVVEEMRDFVRSAFKPAGPSARPGDYDIGQLYLRGIQLMNDKDYDNAELFLKSAIDRAPEKVLYYLWMCEAVCRNYDMLKADKLGAAKEERALAHQVLDECMDVNKEDIQSNSDFKRFYEKLNERLKNMDADPL